MPTEEKLDSAKEMTFSNQLLDFIFIDKQKHYCCCIYSLGFDRRSRDLLSSGWFHFLLISSFSNLFSFVLQDSNSDELTFMFHTYLLSYKFLEKLLSLFDFFFLFTRPHLVFSPKLTRLNLKKQKIRVF